ncbi:MAG: LysR family transcriptional regulator, partial [Candidatus Eiseniibacteriota bacterium]
MNLNHLQHFLAVAENGSVRAAADALGLSQPAVSKSVRTLETALGVPLLQRGTRGSTLTAFGNALYSRARCIGNEMERLTDELRQLAGAADGHVALGTSATASLALLPSALPAYRAANPRVRVDMVGGLPSILLPQLADGSLDLVVGPRPVQPMPPQIASWKLYERESVIAVRRGHPLERAHSLRSFVDSEWVLNTCAGRAESSLQAAFVAAGLPPLKITLHADSLWAAHTMIARADYVGVLPREVVDQSMTGERLVAVDVPEFR